MGALLAGAAYCEQICTEYSDQSSLLFCGVLGSKAMVSDWQVFRMIQGDQHSRSSHGLQLFISDRLRHVG
jgi:hypothetical protein